MASPGRMGGWPTFVAITALVAVASGCGSTGEPSKATPRASGEPPTSAAASAASAAASEGETVTVTIGDRTFGVAEITVPDGDVTFVNGSDLDHTVTEGENGGEVTDPRVNEVLLIGQTRDVSFPEPGDYRITCLFHEEMNMVVHVE